MATSQESHAEGAGTRKKLSPATLAALWTVSNGQCYAPGCPMPVVLEVRPGVFKKNSQVAHIYGVKPGAARYQGDLPPGERDSFRNLLLLCLAHHAEIDEDRDRYSPEKLQEWKTEHEGAQNSVLNRLRVPNADALVDILAEIAEPPLNRLEAITKRLEQTGEVTADTVNELKQIMRMMGDPGANVDRHTAQLLAYAAEVFSSSGLSRSATNLSHAAEVLPGVARDLTRAAGMIEGFR